MCSMGMRLRFCSTDPHLPPHTLTGDFYITRHSNLSQVHVVMHLVTDETAVQSSTLRARNPVMQGLKNCLRTAARHDIHNVTVPLLLVHSMLPVCVMCGMCVVCVCVTGVMLRLSLLTTLQEMTINWCLKRSELVFKCVKGIVTFLVFDLELYS